MFSPIDTMKRINLDPRFNGKVATVLEVKGDTIRVQFTNGRHWTLYFSALWLQNA